jgi:hypothetical protein
MAVKTKAQILTEISTLLADNTTGDISANDVRTVVNDITDSYEDLITAGTTSQYWRGDKTWQTLPIYELDGTLTAAQINALDTTPIQVIAAQGANKIVLVESVTAKFTYIAPAYTTTGEVWTTYDETDVNQRITTLIDDIRLTGSNNAWITNTGVQIKLYSTSIENKPVKLYCDAAISGGAGTLKYNIKYRIISF